MKSKDLHRLKILEYLSNPENDFLKRTKFSTEILGKKQSNYVHRIFTPSELFDLECEARDLRRKRLIRESVSIDRALINDCKEPGCDAATRRLYYEKIEGWKPGAKVEIEPITGTGENDNKWILEVHHVKKHDKTDDIRQTVAADQKTKKH